MGKTTLVRSRYPDLRYLNLDAVEDRQALAALRTRLWAEEVGEAVIDEAQKEPSVFEKVKYAFDEGAIDFSVLLGSSRVLLLDRVRESLAGRAFVFELWPLMACEIRRSVKDRGDTPVFDRLLEGADGPGLTLRDLPAMLLGEEAESRRRSIEHLLAWGGMPELLRLKDDQRREWMRSYQITWLERDIMDLGLRPDLLPFRQLQTLAMARTGQLLSFSALGRDAGIAATTARRYFEYLKLSHQVVLLPPYSRNLTSTVVKSPKIYWTDIGLLRQGTGIWGPATGPIFETLVVTEAMKWVSTSGRNAELSFYRTRSGMEVDLLVSTPTGLLGIEIKSRGVAHRTDTRALKSLARAAGKEWRGGLVVYSGDQIRPLDPEHDIWAVPVHRLF